MGVAIGAAAIAVFATACFPTGPLADWVPDTNKDGVISDAEVTAQKQAIIAEVVAAVDARRRNVQANSTLVCIRHHESDRGPYPHANGYGAHNGRSSAAGAYQFLDSTWRNVSAKAGHGGYSRASSAPWYVQDAVAMWVINNHGKSAWRGSGC